MDEVRNRYLRDRVMTATPAQRVVMIFDRLVLDLARARSAAADESPNSVATAGPHLGHAVSIVAELATSLDPSAGGPADGLAQIYGFLLGELTAIRASGEVARLDAVDEIVGGLREAFAQVAAEVAGSAATATLASAASAFARSGGDAAPRAAAWVG